MREPSGETGMSRLATGRRITAAGAVGTALALSLTACLGESGGTGAAGTDGTGEMKLAAAQAIAKTSQKAGQADTFKATVTVDNRTTEGVNRVRATGRFRLKPTLSFAGSVDEVSRNGSSVPGAGAQAVLLDRVAYVRIPQLQALAGGKPWLKVDLGQIGTRTGVDVDQVLKVIEKVDPAEQTKMFTGSTDARKVGTETIDGVKTTHYVGTVTVAEALAKLDAEARRKAQQVLPSSGSSKIAFDLWVDGGQLPRKLSSKVDNAKNEKSTVTVVYRDYGKPVSVTAPPPAQVGEFRLPG